MAATYIHTDRRLLIAIITNISTSDVWVVRGSFAEIDSTIYDLAKLMEGDWVRVLRQRLVHKNGRSVTLITKLNRYWDPRAQLIRGIDPKTPIFVTEDGLGV